MRTSPTPTPTHLLTPTQSETGQTYDSVERKPVSLPACLIETLEKNTENLKAAEQARHEAAEKERCERRAAEASQRKEKGAAFRFRALIPPEGLVLSPMTRFPVCGAKRSSSTSTLDSSLAVRGKEKATYDAIFTQARFGVVLQEVMQQRSQNKRPPRSRVYRTALV